MKQEIRERIEKIQKDEVPEGYRKTKVGIIPIAWGVVPTNKVLKTVKKAVNVEPNTEYREIGIRSHGKGIFHKKLVQGNKLGNKRVFWVDEKCFIVNIVFAWEQAIAMTSENERGLIASHRFPMYKPKNDLIYLDYLLAFYQSPRGKFQLNLASPGGAGRNKTLGQKEFSQSLIPLPTIYEQQKIAEILSTWNQAIECKEILIQEKYEFKKAPAGAKLTVAFISVDLIFPVLYS
jgi:type I restriction enzyme S subunit